MIDSHSTAVGERQPRASGTYHMEGAFLGMKPIQKKAQPNKGRARPRPNKIKPPSPAVPEAIYGWDFHLYEPLHSLCCLIQIPIVFLSLATATNPD